MRKRQRESLKASLDFHRLSGQASPTAYTTSAARCGARHLSLRSGFPAVWPFVSLHRAPAADVFWEADWEAAVHCNTKGAPIAESGRGSVLGLCPCFPFHPRCAPLLPPLSQLRSAERLPKVFREGSFKPPLSPGTHL